MSMGHDKNKLEKVFVTLNGSIIQMPISVKVVFRDKYKLRNLNGEAFFYYCTSCQDREHLGMH